MTTARVAAARALLAIAAREATFGAAVDEAARLLPDARDRAFTLELVGGVLRWQRELDAVIAAAAQRAARTIDPVPLTVLRLGAYQFRHLTRVPPHAVVSESVETVRALGAPNAAGFTNAVLRAILRRGPAIALPRRPAPDSPRERQIAYLSITLSHPAWLVERWLDRHGFDATEAWCRFNNQPAGVTIRPVAEMTTEALAGALRGAGIEATPAPFVDDALRLPPGALGRVPDTLRHAMWIQDEGAQLVARAAGARPGEAVLDVCAAPGGKSIVLAADLGLDRNAPGSRLVAADFRPARVALLARVLTSARQAVPVVRLDAREPLPFGPVFDCVVVDVPCSGLGTIRSEPDIKWTRQAEELPALAAVEARILRAAAATVRPGGRLVYATCSSEPEENDQVVDGFLGDDERFREGTLASGIPARLAVSRGRMMTRPDLHGLEAFYAAVLVRVKGT